VDVAVLVVDGCFDSGLAAVVDVLATANALRADVSQPPPSFGITIVGVTKRVRTGNGLLVEPVPVGSLPELPDLLVMPALGVRSPEQILDIVHAHPALDLVRAVEAVGSELAGACTGTFFLAEAGVLDGRLATTSWWLGPTFRSRYPHVVLEETRTLARDAQVTTAAAAFAHIDLALSIVHQRSPALAELTARYLLIGDRPSQAEFAVPELLARADPTMAAFEHWVRAHLSEPMSIAAAARDLGISERTLQRTTSSVVGMSPIDFVQEIRLDEATYLLRKTSMSVDAIAAAVGYRNAGTLRSLVRRRRNSSVRALREGSSRR
jgi:transcriptional regulator GlxA family with amidase domain